MIGSKILPNVSRAAALAYVSAGLAVACGWVDDGRPPVRLNKHGKVEVTVKRQPTCSLSNQDYRCVSTWRSNETISLQRFRFPEINYDPSFITVLLLSIFSVSHCAGDASDNKWNDADSVACKKAADDGDAAAQHAMARNYHHGTGVSKNMKESFRYAKVAADQGYAAAMEDMGGCYIHGIGVKQNDNEAFKYYMKGCELGDAGCMYNAAICYGSGRGTPEDKKMSFKYLKRACDLGHAAAAGALGIAYTNGLGVEVNETEAAKYYLLGAERGDTVAQRSIATCYWNALGVDKDLEKSIFFFKLAAENGDLPSQRMLGKVYSHGFETIEKSTGEAKRYFGMAAAQGDKQSKIDQGAVILDEIVGVFSIVFGSR